VATGLLDIGKGIWMLRRDIPLLVGIRNTWQGILAFKKKDNLRAGQRTAGIRTDFSFSFFSREFSKTRELGG